MRTFGLGLSQSQHLNIWSALRSYIDQTIFLARDEVRQETEESNCFNCRNAQDIRETPSPQGVVFIFFSYRKSTEHVLSKMMCEIPKNKTYRIDPLGMKAEGMEKSPLPFTRPCSLDPLQFSYGKLSDTQISRELHELRLFCSQKKELNMTKNEIK